MSSEHDRDIGLACKNIESVHSTMIWMIGGRTVHFINFGCGSACGIQATVLMVETFHNILHVDILWLPKLNSIEFYVFSIIKMTQILNTDHQSAAITIVLQEHLSKRH